MPVISVIVPVYNVELYLRRCVDSILNQTFTDFELILVDDGSLDGSLAICDGYVGQDRRVKAVHQENGGAAAARNTGIQEARGKFVVFVDADDIIGKDYLLNLYSKGKDYDLVIAKMASFSKNEPKMEARACGESYIAVGADKIDVLFLFENFNMWGPYAKRFKTEILRANNSKFPLLRWGEDAVFVANYLSHCNSVMCVDDIDYYYRKGANINSLTSMIRTDSVDLVYQSRNGVYAALSVMDKNEKLKKYLDNDIKRNCQEYLDALFTRRLSPLERYACLKQYLKIPYIRDNLIESPRYTPRRKSFGRCIMCTKNAWLITAYFSIRERILEWKARRKQV